METKAEYTTQAERKPRKRPNRVRASAMLLRLTGQEQELIKTAALELGMAQEEYTRQIVLAASTSVIRFAEVESDN